MDIEKYKTELETAIYEGADGRFYIGGKAIEKVLKEAVTEALRIHDVVGRSEQLKAIEGLKKHCEQMYEHWDRNEIERLVDSL